MSTAKKRAKGIYLLPNIFTTVSLFSAYYSIVASTQHHYEIAVIAIFVGMIADGLDGRVARLTNTQSEFGAQYDSLSDMVTFGVAPSLLAYHWTLSGLGKLGWLAAFTFTASVALRLARFNTQINVVSKRYFVGLNAPAGAGIITSFIWLVTSQGLDEALFSVPLAIGMVLVALLMVSNIRFHSFKEIDFKGKVPFRYVLMVLLAIIAIASYPALILLLTTISYALSGPIAYLLRQRRAAKKLKK